MSRLGIFTALRKAAWPELIRIPAARLLGRTKLLNKLIQDHTKDSIAPPISVFGHADPTGADDHNKNLSERRAPAVYGRFEDFSSSGRAVGKQFAVTVDRS